MSQRRTHSIAEAILNTATGFIISYAVTVYAYHVMGVTVSHSQNLTVVGILTIVSIVRSYVWRRVFNMKEQTK